VLGFLAFPGFFIALAGLFLVCVLGFAGASAAAGFADPTGLKGLLDGVIIFTSKHYSQILSTLRVLSAKAQSRQVNV
jgi:hypothetical protein